MGPGGEEPVDLVNLNETGVAVRGTPCWSPDGKELVWLCSKRRREFPQVYDFHLLFVSADGNRVRREGPGGLAWCGSIDWR